MLVAILAMFTFLDAHTTPDPATLVDQLGSSRYTSRVSAEGELARLGRSALPALRAAKNSKDAEIRTRSVALVARIEDSLLLEATPINLDFRDLPLRDVIEAIGRQSGLGISLSPEERPQLADRRISVRSETPLPFWQAIDAVCSAGNLHPDLSDQPTRGVSQEMLLLLDGPKIGAEPVCDDGAFRVHLTSVHYQSQIDLVQPRPSLSAREAPPDISNDGSRPRSPASREFYLQIILSAEPRLSITRNGPIKVTAAVDDRGRSLVNPFEAGHDARSTSYFGRCPSTILRSRIDLFYPDAPSKVIRIMRGHIPVVVTTRKAEPIMVPLAESRGRVFRNYDAFLTLLDYRPATKNQPSTVEVSIKPLGPTDAPIDPRNGEPLAYRPETFQRQIEILDAKGQPLRWFPSSTYYNGEETRLTMTLNSSGGADLPRTLQFHGIQSRNSEVAFEFRDIPIP